MYLIFAAIMLIASALVVIRLPKPRNDASSRPATGKEKKPYLFADSIRSGAKAGFRGFSIAPGGDCCQASLELQRLTFTCRDNISLPLSSCDRKVCSCQRTQIKERRKYHRRSSLDRRNQVRFDLNSKDRRVNKGRREQDKIWSGGHVY